MTDTHLEIEPDTQMTCQHCQSYDNLKGLCRRRTPVQMIDTGNPSEPYFGWPEVLRNDWCGELEVTAQVREAIHRWTK